MGELTEGLVAQQRELLEGFKEAVGNDKIIADSLRRLTNISESLSRRVEELERRVTALEQDA